jgi:hypothetical protein
MQGRRVEASSNAAINRPAVEAGGDFADGVMACEGNWLDGEMSVSFGKKAATILK